MRIMLFVGLFLVLIYSFECKEKFSLQTQGNLSSLEILEEIAQTCKIHLIYLDDFSKELLMQEKPKINVQKINANSFINLLLEINHLHATQENQFLKISFLYTQTYEINYISTSRVGSSSTDVVLSPDPTSSSLPLSANSQDLLTLSTNQANSGRSGTKILSIDENNFWINLEKEIYSIAYRPEDKLSQKIPKSITINKNAGLLTITTTKNGHKRVKDYLDRLNTKMHSQVLIDVHILTIKHNQSKKTGINWNELYNLGSFVIPAANLAGGTSFLQLGKSGINMELNILSQGVSLNRIIEFLETYGETRSLSNPKVLTLNNQPAIISVGSVLRYIQNSVYQSSSQGSNIQNSMETYPSVFAGVLLDVTPSIQGEEIILKINPSITRAKDLSLENEPNALKTPPNLSTNQLSSIVKVKSGEKIVLGGLISEIENKKEFKVPLLGDIPLINTLFKYKWKSHFSEEMVIIISPKIIQTKTKTTNQDFQNNLKMFLRETRFEFLQKAYDDSKNSR